MKRVYICAPLSDNPNQDVIEAVRFGEYAMRCGSGRSAFSHLNG